MDSGKQGSLPAEAVCCDVPDCPLPVSRLAREYFKVQSLILGEDVGTLLSDTMCRAGHFKRSHEMDVSNTNVMFNRLLPRSSDGVPGTLGRRSPRDLDDTL